MTKSRKEHMETMRYRLIALVLAMLMVWPGMYAAAETEEENAAAPITTREFEALGALHVLTDDFLSMSAEDMVSRARFVGALSKLAGLPVENRTEKLPFSDVNATTPYHNDIVYFYKAGLINGNEDNTFSPNDPITYVQALKMSIDLLGYKEYTAERYGAYPMGYLLAAKNFELSDGLSVSGSEEALTAVDAVTLLYHCAMTCVAVPKTFGGDGKTTYQPDSSRYLLSEYRNIYYGKGIVTDNGIVSLSDDECGEGRARIDDKVYELGNDMDLMDAIGYRVEFFYLSKGGADTLLWISEDKNNKVLRIKSDDLSTDDPSYGADTIVYYQNDRKKTARIDRYADVIYNYALCNQYDADRIKPKSGDVKLIDSNDDGVYEVVAVSEFQNLFVAAVSAERNTVSGRYGDALELDDYKTVRILKNGVTVTRDEIQKDTVISYIESPDKKFLYIYVNAPRSIEKLTTVSEDGGKTYYTFESGKYRLADSLKRLMENGTYHIPSVQLGNRYQYCLDMAGEIAAIELDNESLQYAFLVDGAKEDAVFASSGSAQFKLVLKDGSVVTAVTADKISFNGAKGMKGADVLDAAVLNGEIVQQVVRVAFNGDGNIKEFELASDVAESSEYGYDKRKFTCDYVNQKAVYNTDNCYIFSNKYLVNGETVCFVKYQNKDGSADYGVIPYTTFSNGSEYDIKLYDCDEYLTAAAMSVVKDGMGYQETYILVDGVSSVLDQDKNTCLQLEGLAYGKNVKYTANDDGTIPDEIKRGDIVQVSVGLIDNRIERLRKVCSLRDRPESFINGKPGNIVTEIFGYLYSNSGRNIVTLNPYGSPYGKLIATSTSNGTPGISVYDCKRDTVSVGNLHDLYPINGPESNGALHITDDSVMVFVYRRYNWVKDIVVVYY